MRTFDVIAMGKETILAKLCINVEIYNTINDESLAVCLNSFLYNIGAKIRVNVVNKHIDVYNDIKHNAVLRTSVNNTKVWFLYGFRETTYCVKEKN